MPHSLKEKKRDEDSIHSNDCYLISDFHNRIEYKRDA